MKPCSRCHITKPLDEFRNKADTKDGKAACCRICIRIVEGRKLREQGIPAKPAFLNRLWDNIRQCGHGDVCIYCCWPWMKSCSVYGYGRIGISFNGTDKIYHVTRIIFEIWHAKQLSNDLSICHHCDNPPCCNPTHLFHGTDYDNMHDCIKKGRNIKAIGVDASQTKLSEDDVKTIRLLKKDGLTSRDLGTMFGVSHTNINAILHRKTWKHI